MFFKRRKKISTKLPKGKRIPILILDKAYHEIGKNIGKSQEIIKLEEELKDLLKEMGQTTNDLEAWKKEKKKKLNRILSLTEEAYEKDNQQAKDEMILMQNDVINLNEQIEKAGKRIEDLPGEIEEANEKLLDKMAVLIYGTIRTDRYRLNAITPEIETHREKLKSLIEEKGLLEEKTQTTYAFLHNLLGNEMLDELDKEFEAYDSGNRN